MPKRDSAVPVWERMTKNARMGSDRKRRLYVAARRLVAPTRAAVRSVEARESGGGSLAVPQSEGYALFGSGTFAESGEIVELATRRLSEVDPETIRERGKPFMAPILDSA